MSANKSMQAAEHWLNLGFDLIPIQPNTKHIMRGFGVHQRRVTSRDEINAWWGKGHNNIAVIAKGENFILDFDDMDLYTAWARVADDGFTNSYTEFTPRGAHVFFCGQVVEGLQLKPGVEIKHIAIVAPSVVGGVEYIGLTGAIYRGDVDGVFSSLSITGTRTPYALRADQKRGDQAQAVNFGSSPVQRIKQTFSVLEVFQKLSPTKHSIRGTGRYISAKCPFHKNGREEQNSFYLDTQKNIFGCHACGVHGDVINLYARFTGRTVPETIQALKAEVAR